MQHLSVDAIGRDHVHRSTALTPAWGSDRSLNARDVPVVLGGAEVTALPVKHVAESDPHGLRRRAGIARNDGRSVELRGFEPLTS